MSQKAPLPSLTGHRLKTRKRGKISFAFGMMFGNFSNFLIRLRYDLRNNLTVTAFIQIVVYSLKPHKWTRNRVNWHFLLFPKHKFERNICLFVDSKSSWFSKSFLKHKPFLNLSNMQMMKSLPLRVKWEMFLFRLSDSQIIVKQAATFVRFLLFYVFLFQQSSLWSLSTFRTPVHHILSFSDEKKQYDPIGFRDAILEGLEACGSDLEAVSKFLDVSGSKLDYRRYGVNLIEILIAGGLLGKHTALILRDEIPFLINLILFWV